MGIKVKKVRKPSRKALSNKLDAICSLIIRSKGYCSWCSKADYEKLQCAHIYSRTYKSVRWDLKNMLCLCAGCHFYAHKNPIAFTEFVRTYLGEYEYEMLKQRAVPVSHHKLHHLVAIYESLQKTKDADHK